METLVSQVMSFILSKAEKNETVAKVNKEFSEALWAWIRPIFLKDEEPLQDLLKEPNDKDNQVEVETKVKKYIKKHPDQEEELKQILNQYNDKSVTSVKFISQHHEGTGDNIGGDKISGDKIIQ